ncbi:helix-turn-helix transcriptional regulator [Glycomyces tenuis]|uniref:helix-turn-helix transcriptional regulator n=1 Tax=Glycomyces tenuis TaxID=58116 RepID=UPI00041B3551|nr:LuxR family transcriptional regulator [Glycomyces tenuis]
MLYGRAQEIAGLESLLEDARASRGSALVIRGEAGIGKSTLVDAAAEAAADFTVLRCVGVESEHAWSYAGLQALLLPLTGHLDALADSHACVLRTVLGLNPDLKKRPPSEQERLDSRFIIGVAVLSLLAEAAAAKPVLCVVDDAHWLDPDSAEVLLFVARRLTAEPIAMLFAARDGYAPDFPAPGVDELSVGPLDDAAAASLLGERLTGMPQTARQRLLQAAAGNPLALLELPPTEPDARPATDRPGHRRSTTARLTQAFRDRIDRLPEATRTLLLVIAAEDTGDTGTVLAAAGKLGAGLSDLAPAEADDLVHFAQDRFEFGHPLIRSAAYQGAPSYRRVEAHLAIAEAMDEADHRRAFHLAAATTGPDESVAAALEASGECVRGCGGHRVEYSIYERAAAFTPDGHEKGRRLVLAAEAAMLAGNGAKAAELCAQVGYWTRDRRLLARATTVGASVASWGGEVHEAYRLWMEAADHYQASRPEAAGYPLFRAVELAWQGGDFSRAEVTAEYAERLGLEHAPWVRALAVATAGFNRSCAFTVADAVDSLRHLIGIHEEFGPRTSLEDRAMITWWRLLIGDIDRAERSGAALVRECRESGASGPLPRALALYAVTEFHRGRWADAVALAENSVEISYELGQRIGPVKARAWVLAPIAALRGDEVRARELIGSALDESPAGTLVAVDTALALLDFSLGRYEETLDRYMARFESEAPGDALTHAPVAVEAAVRVGDPGRVAEVFSWFRLWAEATGVPHWQAMVERCLGLLAPEEEAGKHYERAAELHREADAFPFETARTELVLGEWLRRARRVGEAKTRLRAAAETFERLGAAPWTERVRRELRAAGDAGPVENGPGLAERLTPQELQVVRLAAAGLSNREIGEQLYLSPRTAGYHLYKAYPKLGVASRNELSRLGL